MSDALTSPKQKALRKAVADYCEKTGVNAATISVVTEKIVGLIASRWEHICDVALGEENEGKVNVGLRVNFDMSHKTPVGTVTLAFSQRTQDDCAFQVEDPNQPGLPFSEAVRPSAVQQPEPVAQQPRTRTRRRAAAAAA